MNKITNPNPDSEIPDDYSEMLDEYDFSKAVRGKYYQRYPRDGQKPLVKITGKDGDRYVTLRTIETQAIIAPDGKLTVQVTSDITPGEYRIIMMIEETTIPASHEIDKSNQNKPK